MTELNKIKSQLFAIPRIKESIRKKAIFSLVMKRVSRPVSQELTRQLSIRHCQLVQCHELREMRRPITGMKNDPRKPLIFRLLFPRGIQRICIEFLDTETKRNFYFYFFSFSFLTLLSFINERKITRRMITWWSSSDSEESRYCWYKEIYRLLHR